MREHVRRSASKLQRCFRGNRLHVGNTADAIRAKDFLLLGHRLIETLKARFVNAKFWSAKAPGGRIRPGKPPIRVADVQILVPADVISKRYWLRAYNSNRTSPNSNVIKVKDEKSVSYSCAVLSASRRTGLAEYRTFPLRQRTLYKLERR